MHSATKIGLFFQAQQSAKSRFVAAFSVVLALLALSAPAAQAVCTASTQGNWSVGGNWTGCSGTGGIPGTGDAVTIPSGITMSLDNAASPVTISALTINNAGAATGITILNSNSLTVTNATTLSTVSAGAGTSSISIGSGTFVAGGGLTINGSATGLRICQVTMNTAGGTLTLGSGLTFAGTAAQAKFTNTAASTINLQGGSISAGGTVGIAAGTTLVATGGTIAGGYTFGILNVTTGDTLSLAGVATITFAGATTIDGTLNTSGAGGSYVFSGAVTVDSGGTFSMSNNPTLSFAAGITMNGTTFNAGTGATAFSLSQTLAGNQPMTFGGSVTPASLQTITNNSTNTVTINGTLTLTGGWTQGPNSTLVLGNAAPTSGAGTFNATTNTNTVIFTANNATLTQTQFDNVEYEPSGANAQTLPTGTINIAGTLTIGNGTNAGATAATNSPTINVTGATLINSGATFAIGGNAINFTGGLTINGTMNGAAGGAVTVTGNVTGGGTINLTGDTFTQVTSTSALFFTTSGNNNWIFNNLRFSNGGAGPGYTISVATGTSTGNITVNTTLTVGVSGDNGPITFDPGGITWTMPGGSVVFGSAGSTLCPTTTCSDNISTFIFGNPGGITIPATLGFYNITRNPVIQFNIGDTLAGPLTAAGAFTISPSTNNAGVTYINDNVTLSGGGLTVGGLLTITRGTDGYTTFTTGANQPLTVGSLTINNGPINTSNDALTLNNSLFTITGTGTSLTIGGGNVTFNQGTSTVLYTGNGANVTCNENIALTYYNLELEPSGTSNDTICLATGKTLTVSNSLTIGDGTHTGGATADAYASTIVTLSAPATLTIANNSAFLSGNNAVSVGGTTVITGTYTVSGTGETTLVGAVTLNGAFNGTTAGSVTVNGSFTGAGSVDLTGDTFEQRVAAAQNFGATAGSNAWIFDNLVFSATPAAAETITTLTGGSGGITVSGTLTLDRAADTKVLTLNPGNQTWTLTNTGTPIVFNILSVLCPPGTCPTNSSTFEFNNSGGVTVPISVGYYNLLLDPAIAGPVADTLAGAATAYNNITINPNGGGSANGLTVTLGGNITVTNGILTLEGASNGYSVLDTKSGSNYAVTANAISINGGSTGAVNNFIAENSTVTLTGTGTPFSLGASSATFTRGNSTVNYIGNGATILVMGNGAGGTTNSYYNLGLEPNGSVQQVLGSGTLDVSNNLTIGNGINSGANASGNPAINLFGNLAISALATYTKGAGTTSFLKNGTQTWTDSTASGQDLGTVLINGNNTIVTLGSAVVASTITINPSMTLLTNGATHTLNAKNLINDGTFTGTSSLINLSGTGLTFTNPGTLSVVGSTMNLTGSGTQQIDGQGATFGMVVDSNTSSGGVSFISNFTSPELYVNAASLSAGVNMHFIAGDTFTITNLYLNGSSGNGITVQNSNAGTWLLNNTSTNTVTYVTAANSDARSGVTIQAGGGTDTNSGGNINWYFTNTGQTVTATKNGNWSNTTTWDGGFVPTNRNPVVIPNGNTVTVDISTATANSVTINNSAGTTGITISGSNQLAVSNAITCNAPTGSLNSVIAIGAGTLISTGTLTLNGGSTGLCEVTLGTGILTLGNGMTFAGTVANTEFNNTLAGTINLKGGTISGATPNFFVNSGTTLNATGGGIAGAYTFGNLSVPSGNLDLWNYAINFAGSSSITGILDTVVGLGTYTFTGAVTVNAGGDFDLSAENPTLSFGAGITMNGTTFLAGSGAAAFTATANLAGTGNMTFGGSVTPATGHTITNINTSTVTINGTLALSGNWTQGVNSTLVLGSAASTSGSGTLTATASGNTINYSGAGTTVKPVTYNTLILSGSGIDTMTGVTTTTSDFDIQGAVTATSVLTSIGGNLNVNGTAVLTLGAALTVSSNTNVSAGTLTDGNFTLVTGTTTVGGSGTYTHSGNALVTVTGSLTVNGTLNGPGTGSIVVSSGIAGTGTVDLTSSTFEQRVAAAQNFGATSGSNNWIFDNLTFSDSSGATAYTIATQTGGSGGITVSGILSLGRVGDTKATTLNPGNQTWTLSGSGTPLVFNAGGALCAPGACATNTSTFQYTGTAATTLTASTSYYNLTINPTITGAVTDTLGGAITVNNNFLINPTAASANGLTVTLGGALNVTNGTLTVEGTTNGFAVLDTKSGSNYAITANTINIAAGASGSR